MRNHINKTGTYDECNKIELKTKLTSTTFSSESPTNHMFHKSHSTTFVKPFTTNAGLILSGS